MESGGWLGKEIPVFLGSALPTFGDAVPSPWGGSVSSPPTDNQKEEHPEKEEGAVWALPEAVPGGQGPPLGARGAHLPRGPLSPTALTLPQETGGTLDSM